MCLTETTRRQVPSRACSGPDTDLLESESAVEKEVNAIHLELQTLPAVVEGSTAARMGNTCGSV